MLVCLYHMALLVNTSNWVKSINISRILQFLLGQTSHLSQSINLPIKSIASNYKWTFMKDLRTLSNVTKLCTEVGISILKQNKLMFWVWEKKFGRMEFHHWKMEEHFEQWNDFMIISSWDSNVHVEWTKNVLSRWKLWVCADALVPWHRSWSPAQSRWIESAWCYRLAWSDIGVTTTCGCCFL